MGVTPGALVMASKWTIPMRPAPMTPTLTSLVATFSTFMLRNDALRPTLAPGAKAELPWASDATTAMVRENFMVVMLFSQWDVCKQARNGQRTKRKRALDAICGHVLLKIAFRHLSGTADTQNQAAERCRQSSGVRMRQFSTEIDTLENPFEGTSII